MGVNLLLSRLFLTWLERVLARRRTREAFLVIFLIAIGSVQLLVALVERWGNWVKPLVAMLRTVMDVLPPNLAGHALAGTAANDTAKTAVATGLLAAWGLGFGLLLRRRLRAQYHGADTGEGAPRARPTAEQFVRQGWHLPGLPNAVSALCEKELRYAVRNGQTILSLILPLIVTVFFAWLWSEQQTFLSRIPQELFFPSAVAYAFLALAPLMHNTFGYDGQGIQMLLIAPLSFKRVLLAKNLVHGLLVAFEAGLIWFLVSVLQAPPSVRILAATLAALLFMTLVHFTAGNLLSLYFPRRLEFGQVRRRPSEMTVLMGYVIQVLVMGSVGLIFYTTHTGPRAGGGWLGTVLFLALSAAVLALYVVMLDRCAQIASERHEVLTAELCR